LDNCLCVRFTHFVVAFAFARMFGVFANGYGVDNGIFHVKLHSVQFVHGLDKFGT
jgi:hypothetical protein